MVTYFISDLHLEKGFPTITEKFTQFLHEKASQADALYILGDFFEAWIGDDDDDPFALSILKELSDLASKGIPIYFIRGNRDLLVGQEFATKTGCKVLDDPSVIDLYGTPTLISHGDIYCIDDLAHQAFRQQLLNPLFRQMVAQKPLAERRAIAKELRQRSKDRMQTLAQEIMDVNENAVRESLKNHQVKTLIHGHTHRPGHYKVGNEEERIVLAAWHEKGNALAVLPTGQKELIYF